MKHNPQINETIPVHGYKHNGKIHRVWEKVKIMDITENLIITASNKTLVIESDGRMWKTTEPAISYFYNNYWFNVIAIIRSDGIHFYCNLSSPYVYNEGAIKYIDYDLDVKVFPNYSYRIIDEYEFMKHKHEMNYPPEIQKIIRKQTKILINMINKKEGPFKPGFASYWYDNYKKSKTY